MTPREQPTGAKVTCLCGKTEIVHAGGIKFTAFRCPWCPPDNGPLLPRLRLVRDAD